MPTKASCPRGRHRRTRRDWWRRQRSPDVVVAVTVQELQRRRERERRYADQARRVRVIPRQLATPHGAVTRPDTVSYQGSARV